MLIGQTTAMDVREILEERHPAWHCLVHLAVPVAGCAVTDVVAQVCDLLPPLGLSDVRTEQIGHAVGDAAKHLRSRLDATQPTLVVIVNVLLPQLAQHGGWGFFVVEHMGRGAEHPAVELFLYQETPKTGASRL